MSVNCISLRGLRWVNRLRFVHFIQSVNLTRRTEPANLVAKFQACMWALCRLSSICTCKARICHLRAVCDRARLINSLTGVKLLALQGYPVTLFSGWLNSTVVLDCFNGGGQYKQFVESWLQKSSAESEITWSIPQLKITQLL